MTDFKPKSIAAIPGTIGNTNRGHDNAITSQDAPELLVTLEKINDILMGYLKNRIIPTIDANGINTPVPVIYGTEERWVAIRKEGGLRDPNTGKLQTPLIALRRTNVKKGPLSNPNNKYLHTTLCAGWNARNAYDKFAVLNRITPSRQLRNIMIPDYMDLTYEGVIWTEFQTQMDKVIEQINVENDEFWGERNNFKFRVSIDQFDTQSDLPKEGDRVVKTGFQMKVSAYLIPERLIRNMKLASTTQKEYTVKKVVVFTEVVDSLTPEVTEEGCN
jgi:hypothetical protein